MTVIEDGVYEETVDDSAQLANALLAGGGPLKPPKEWFEHPNLTKATPITVTADGRIYGHIASFDTGHIGLPGQRKPPRSRHDYAFFKTGVLETAEGEDVAVGQLTLAGGHAPLNADAGSAARHYDDTSSAVADVNVGEDVHGIWISGGVRPGIEDTAIRALRASAPSGDWRPINNNLELVAICQVNVPGFPVARAMVAGGEIISLVAAGASDMYRRRLEFATQASVDELRARLTQFEDSLTASAPAAVDDEVDLDAAAAAIAAEEAAEEFDEQEARLMDLRGRLDAIEPITASMSKKAWAKIGDKALRKPRGTEAGGEFTDKPGGGGRPRPKLPEKKKVTGRKEAARARMEKTVADDKRRGAKGIRPDVAEKMRADEHYDEKSGKIAKTTDADRDAVLSRGDKVKPAQIDKAIDFIEKRRDQLEAEEPDGWHYEDGELSEDKQWLDDMRTGLFHDAVEPEDMAELRRLIKKYH